MPRTMYLRRQIECDFDGLMVVHHSFGFWIDNGVVREARTLGGDVVDVLKAIAVLCIMIVQQVMSR